MKKPAKIFVAIVCSVGIIYDVSVWYSLDSRSPGDILVHYWWAVFFGLAWGMDWIGRRFGGKKTG
ncbi:MAG: hypothetical protein HYR55_12145 [Acidobacteria bacterium]|nr:hypothetical protein [Acidobacteriota bacterium]MBI3655460.1 hypothetical protein [Acidobacteriota bacterium]